jgi:ABC-type transport system involved in multi-copper enzyme maturation permease subunit
MILEQNILPFFEWFPTAALDWIQAIAVLLVVALFVGALFSIIRHGLSGFLTPFAHAVERGIENITSLSFARTWAIARLTIKESIRRRVLFVFALFMILLLFAGWFLDPNSEDPAKLYMSFVMSATTILVLLLSLFLSSFSLPTDFKTKTIYSVVTKPVRSSELVFGRVLGIGLIGTVILILMGISSYLFVTNGLQHSHLLTEKEDLTPVSIEAGTTTINDPKRIVFRGETRLTNGHKHPVVVSADGTVSVGMVNGHTHLITQEKIGDQTRYTVHASQGTLQARIPVYAKLGFRGADGLDSIKGINVGHEWEYRSYIGGSTKLSEGSHEEAAVFAFDGIREEMFPKELFRDGLPVEMTLGVFRTHKGDIEKRVTGSLAVRNPVTGLRIDVMTFSTEEFITKALTIPWTFEGTPQIIQRRGRTQTGTAYAFPDDETTRKEKINPQFTEHREFDFYKDIVADGRFEIWLQCIDNQQYIGVAQADLYLRANDGSVRLNFVKGYFGIWMQMLVVISFGVLFSTFLSGAVAMISTVGIMIAGFSKSFMIEIGLNKVLGGGPFESFYRLLIQQNMVVDLPTSFSTSFIKAADKVFGLFLTLIGQAVPPLSEYAVYDTAVVSGFDIPAGWLLNHGVMTLAYAIPIFIVAYLILSNREVAK